MSTFRNGITELENKSKPKVNNTAIERKEENLRKKTYKTLQRIDHCTWIDLSKVIGVEINFRKKGQKEFYEVVFGYEATTNKNGEGFNSSLEGVIPYIDFRTYDEAKQYVEDLGIHLDNTNKMKFNSDSWEYNDRVITYDLNK